jgi:hypothetical protein
MRGSFLKESQATDHRSLQIRWFFDKRSPHTVIFDIVPHVFIRI